MAAAVLFLRITRETVCCSTGSLEACLALVGVSYTYREYLDTGIFVTVSLTGVTFRLVSLLSIGKPWAGRMQVFDGFRWSLDEWVPGRALVY